MDGPEEVELAWERRVPYAVGEPVVDGRGVVFVAQAPPGGRGRVSAWSGEGRRLWSSVTAGEPTTPCLSIGGGGEAEEVVVAALGRVDWLEGETGRQLRERPIDGIPGPAAVGGIGGGGRVYVAARSFDWAGLYALSMEGDRLWDTGLVEGFRLGLHGYGGLASCPVLGAGGVVAVAFRTFDAYTWDYEEGPEPEHHYHLYLVEGERGEPLAQLESSSIALWGDVAVTAGSRSFLALLGGLLVRVPMDPLPMGDLSRDWSIPQSSLASNYRWEGFEFGGNPALLHQGEEAILALRYSKARVEVDWDRWGEASPQKRAGRLLGFDYAPEITLLHLGEARKTGMEGGERGGNGEEEEGEAEMEGRPEVGLHRVVQLPGRVSCDPAADAQGNLYLGTEGGFLLRLEADSLQVRFLYWAREPISAISLGAPRTLHVLTAGGRLLRLAQNL